MSRKYHEFGDSDDNRRDERRDDSGVVRVRWFDARESRHTASGWLLNSSDDGFGFRSSEQLTPGLTVWLSCNGEPERKAVVRHCEPMQGGWRIGVYWVKVERRRSDRRPAHGRAVLEWEELGQKRNIRVTVVDISEEGARLEGPTAPQAGARCRLSEGALEWFGRVRNLEPRKNQLYRFGLEFDKMP